MSPKVNFIYPKLSYFLVEIFFSAHNELGLYSREKQYGDLIKKRPKEAKVLSKREAVENKKGIG